MRSTRGGVRAQSGINFSRGTNAITHQDNKNTPTKKNPSLEEPQKCCNKYENLKIISINWNIEDKLGSFKVRRKKKSYHGKGRKISEETESTTVVVGKKERRNTQRNGRLASFLCPSPSHFLVWLRDKGPRKWQTCVPCENVLATIGDSFQQFSLGHVRCAPNPGEFIAHLLWQVKHCNTTN